MKIRIEFSAVKIYDNKTYNHETLTRRVAPPCFNDKR